MKDGWAVFRKQKTIEVGFELGGYHIAELFYDLSADEQAEFFKQLGNYEKFAIQMGHITRSRKLRVDGKYAMRIIGESEA